MNTANECCSIKGQVPTRVLRHEYKRVDRFINNGRGDFESDFASRSCIEFIKP